MTRSGFFLSRFSAVAALLSLLVSCGPEKGYVTITGYAQGGTYLVKLDLPEGDGQTAATPSQLKEGIDSVLLAIDNSLSGYNKGSLLSRFNAGEKIIPDQIFKDIYAISYEFYKMTDGCFDVASGPLFDMWGFGFTRDSLPSPEQVETVLARAGMDRLHETMPVQEDGTVSARDLLLDGEGDVVLNYNAVAQGYSCDLVAEYLHSKGVEAMLVDIGGEIYCEGFNAVGKQWTVGLDRPVDGNNVPGADLQGIFRAGPDPCGVVTSGNYRKFYVKNGRKYAHTIDPRTGYPVSHTLLSATVIAKDATEADALATYCMVLGLEGSREFISSRKDLEGYLVYSDGEKMESWSSDGFRMDER